MPDYLRDATEEVGGGTHPGLPQQRGRLHPVYRRQCHRNWCSVVTGARRRRATHSLCKSGAEQVGTKLQCDQEGAAGGGFLLQIFPALSDRKKVQATYRSRGLEMVADLQRCHWNVGQVAKHPGRTQYTGLAGVTATPTV